MNRSVLCLSLVALLTVAGAAAPIAQPLDPVWSRLTLGLPTAVDAADVTGDGLVDAVIGGIHGLKVFDPRAPEHTRTLWNVQGPHVLAVATADVTGDGAADVFAGTGEGNVHAYDGIQGDPIWTLHVGAWAQAVSAVAAEQTSRVAVGDNDGAVHLLDATTGDRVWTAEVPYNALCVSLADLTGDGVADVVAGSVSHSFHAFDGTTGDALWVVNVPGGVRGCLTPDLAGNGNADAVAVSDGGAVVAVAGPTGETLWRHDLPHIGHAGAAGDVTGDGVPDVAVTVRDRTVQLLDGVDGARVWTVGFDQQPEPVAVGDVTGDGVAEVVVGDWAHNVTALDADGTRLWTAAGGAEVQALTLGALDAVDGLDVLAATGAHVAHRAYKIPGDMPEPETWHYDFAAHGFGGATGETRFSEPLYSYTWTAAFADVTGDGVLDVFEANGDLSVYARDGATGRTLWAYDAAGFIAGLATLDRDGDGTPEVAVAAAGRIALLDAATGAELWRVQPEAPWLDVRGLAVGDFDLDGLPDVIAGDSAGVVRAIEALTGTVLWTYQAPAAVHTVAVDDLDGDGADDAVIGTDRNAQNDLIALRGGPAPSVRQEVPPPPLLRPPPQEMPREVKVDMRTLWSYRTDGLVDDVEIVDLETPAGPRPMVVAASWSGTVHAVDATTGAFRWMVGLYGPVRSVAPVNLDADATPEIVFGGESGTVTAVDGDGMLLWETEPVSESHKEAVWTVEPATLPDGRAAVVAAQWNGHVDVLDTSGALVARQPTAWGVYFAATPDLDGDGVSDVVAGIRTGPLSVFKINPE